MALRDQAAQRRQRAGRRFNLVLLAFISLLVVVVGTYALPIAMGQSSTARMLNTLILIPIFLIVLLHFGNFLRGAVAVPELSLLVALAAVSVIWSYDPATTLERAVPLVVTSALAVTLGTILSTRGLVLVFGVIGSMAMIGSLAAVAAFPAARGQPPFEDTWIGIFSHKNELGSAATLSLIIALGAAWISEGRQRLFFQGMAAMAAFLLFASESRTAQIIGLVLLVAMVAAVFQQRHAFIWATFVMFIFMSAVLATYLLIVSGSLEPAFAALDRKPTMSGRIPLWTLTVPKAIDEFWLGYGYHAFWDPNSKRVLEISRDPTLQFTPFYSHNGIIETWLNTGIIGVSLLAASVLRMFTSAFYSLRHATERRGLSTAFVVVLAFLLLDITEARVLARANLQWMIFLAFATKISLVSQVAARAERNRPRRSSMTSPFTGTTSPGKVIE
jgi:exopolysaccharide production protein ExoQ